MKERRKGKKGKKKEREKSRANHGKDWQCITNKFIPFTNKQKEYSYGTTNITSVELTRSKTE